MKIKTDHYNRILDRTELIMDHAMEAIMFRRGYVGDEPQREMTPFYSKEEAIASAEEQNRAAGESTHGVWLTEDLFRCMTAGQDDRSLLMESDSHVNLEATMEAYARRKDLGYRASMAIHDGLKIYSREVHEILDTLLLHQSEGDKLLFSPMNIIAMKSSPVSKYDLEFFSDEFSAAQYARDNRAYLDETQIVHIQSVIDAIGYVLKNDQAPFLDDGALHIEAITKTIRNINIMKQENIDGVKDKVFFTGFDHSLDSTIEENTAKGVATFSGTYKPEYGENVEATAHFSKSAKDNYFFNKWELDINKGTEQAFKQTFMVYPTEKALFKVRDSEPELRWANPNFTVKQGFNMAMGRSTVNDFILPHKFLEVKHGMTPEEVKEITAKNAELEKSPKNAYRAWGKLGFSQLNKYGDYPILKDPLYDIMAKVEKFPIKELLEKDGAAKLLDSLERGNLVPVTMMIGKIEAKYFIEANPQYQTITIYNGNMVRQKHQDILREVAAATGKVYIPEENKKKELTETDKPGQKTVRGKRNDDSVTKRKRSKGISG